MYRLVFSCRKISIKNNAYRAKQTEKWIVSRLHFPLTPHIQPLTFCMSHQKSGLNIEVYFIHFG